MAPAVTDPHAPNRTQSGGPDGDGPATKPARSGGPDGDGPGATKLNEATITADRARPVDGLVREALDVPWSVARDLVRRGKVTVDGKVVLDAITRVKKGGEVNIQPNAVRRDEARFPEERIVFVDPHLVVVDKPSGISTIPFDEGERGTLEELVRQYLVRRHGHPRHASLGVVHRIDKETSGLVVFARTFAAKKVLSFAFREHTIERRYLAIVHGQLRTACTFDSMLIEDRGDGLRGSVKDRIPRNAQRAITHVEPQASSNVASRVACRLETGRTHQIRIHLSEGGHPLVGDRVYTRDHLRAGRTLLQAPRMMLHAEVLGFDHPVTAAPLRFVRPPPADFVATDKKLVGA